MELLNRELPDRQRGLSLIYALLALAALSVASVALMRAINTGSLVAGNLSFQQEATAAADQAVRQAVSSLNGKISALSTNLDADIPGIGYYASTNDLLDVTGAQSSAATRTLVKWTDTYCSEQVSGSYASCVFTPVKLAAAINGNSASYIVFRLCDSAGDPTTVATINCARPLSSSATSSTNESRDYSGGSGTSSGVVSPYYRIVVRVSGARNTVSYTETIMHF